MDYTECMEQLRQHAVVIESLTAGVSQADARRRPSEDAWSVLEVINHLYDEEREDFRTRLDYLLHRPGQAWPPIDPEGWVEARRYNDRELQASLQAFVDERQRSLEWLTSISDPDLEALETHPGAGKLHVGDLLAAWVAHDLLHLRRLVELKCFLVEALASPYSTRYAGKF